MAGLLAQIAATGLEVDVLVNNAGFGLHGNFLTATPAADAALTTVHVEAPLRLTKALLPGMVRRNRGGVLNVGSLYSFSPAPWQALYGAAKGWILSFSLSLREELRGTDVTITALCPGTTLSRFRTRNGHRDRASWLSLTPAEVAAAGYRGFRRRRAVVVPGFASKLYVLGTRLLPTAWLGRYVHYTAYRLRRMPQTVTPGETKP
jgi:short-subunit dehydrogenase